MKAEKIKIVTLNKHCPRLGLYLTIPVPIGLPAFSPNWPIVPQLKIKKRYLKPHFRTTWRIIIPAKNNKVNNFWVNSIWPLLIEAGTIKKISSRQISTSKIKFWRQKEKLWWNSCMPKGPPMHEWEILRRICKRLKIWRHRLKMPAQINCCRTHVKSTLTSRNRPTTNLGQS